MLELNLSRLDRLDEELVYARLLRLQDLTENLGGGIETKRGFVHDFVLRLHSIFGQAWSDEIDLIARSWNPLLLTSADSVESDLLDQLATYQGTARYTALAASGEVLIEISENRTLLVSRGTQFTSPGGQVYVVDRAFVTRPEAESVQDDTDRLLVANQSGNYEFSVPATAIEEGINGRLSQGVEFSLTRGTIPSLVKASVGVAFTGGQDRETDQQLISRLNRAYPAKTLSTRSSLASMLTQPTVMPDVVAISTIGFGDVELQRSKRSGFAGRAADVYLRTTHLPVTRSVRLKATATDVVAGNYARWQISVGRDALPGFYLVTSVTDAQGLQLTVENVQRGYDLSPIVDELTPDIRSAEEAAFSRYQTASVTARTSAGDHSVGDEIDVDVSLSGMPDIDKAQTILGGREFNFVGGDTLARAAVPVFASVGVNLHVRPGVSLPTAASLRSAVADFFNFAGFPGKLHASRLTSRINELLPTGADVHTVEIVADTLSIDGEIHRDRQSLHFEVPELPNVSTTGRTATFFVEPANVVVTPYIENLPLVI